MLAYRNTEDWTKITWTPDLAKFGMTEFDDDIVALFTRRAYDMAGCTHHSVKVYLNGKRIATNNFSNYVDLFLGPKIGGSPRVLEKVSDRWEVAIAPSDDGFQQFSFVNSIATTKGGTHVNHVADQVVEKVLEFMKKKHKGMEKSLKPAHVKAHMKVFVNCLIENPAFDSQTKEYMTLKPSAFGSKCSFSDKFFKDVLNCGVLESILTFAQNKQNKDLKKTDGAKKARLTGIQKLDDANEAGGKNGYKCTLIITEGDSAKALAVSGLSVIGRDYYGVFPLRGKLLNVRDANHSTIMNNKEISELKQILGLQQGKDYTDESQRKSLRYGHLMVMTDQDHDGSHIKGLIINFLHCYWPNLLKKTDFLREFVTPIVKASKGKQAIPFFTLREYNEWREGLGGAANSWNVKYYKGLGTSTSIEAKQYFSDLPQHELTFTWGSDQDGALIEKAFAKSMADARKDWLRSYDPNVYVDHSASTLSYGTFIDNELIHFSNADNVRSIPSFVDGLKPGQRKILFACFKRGKGMIKNEIKVAQLSGYVAEHSAYHHGETSLAGTIVGMAQTFVGSNNIALLHPAGQFGTRLLGGKDAASPRYIFTKLPTLTRLIFHPDDDALLDYLEDDGQAIEPKFYMPVLPMVLINGADGIGTGWSTSVPNYNPRDVVDNLKRMMEGGEPEPMAPWYRGFTGTIVPADAKNSTFTTFGTVGKLDSTTLHISELPIRKWTQDYKDSVLEPLLSGAEGKASEKGEGNGKATSDPLLTDIREHHTDTTVSFSIKMKDAELLGELETKGLLHKQLKLSSSISTSNMTLFDEHARIVKHETPEDILSSFYTLRLSYYEKRKMKLSESLTEQWSKLDNRMRFVLAVVSGELKISNVKKAVLVETLKKQGYATFEPPSKKKAQNEAADDDEEDDAVDVGAAEAGANTKAAAQAAARGYDYLLGMPLWSLTMEKVEQLRAELAAKEAELQTLLATSTKQLWTKDLDAFLAGYEQWEAELAAAEAGAPKPKAGGKGGKAPAKKAYAKKKAYASSDEDDDDDDFSEEDSDSDYDEKKKKKKAPAKKAKEAAPMPPPSAAAVQVIAAPSVPLAAGPKRKAPSNAGSRPGSSLASEGSSRPASRAGSEPPATLAEVSDEDEGGMSLAQRMLAKVNKGGVAASPKPVAKRVCDKESPVGAIGALAALLGGGAMAAAKKPAILDESMDDASDAEEEEKPPPKSKAAPAKKAPPAKKAAPAKKAKKDESDDDFSDDDDASEPEVMPAARPSARGPGRAAAQKAVAKYADLSDEDDEASDMEEEEEEEKPKAKPPPKAKAAPKAAPAAKKAPPKKKAPASDDDDDGASDFEPEEKPKKAPPKPKAAPAKKAPPAKKAAPAKKAKKDESDDDFSDDDDASEPEVMPAARPSARGPGRAAAQKAVAKYADLSDEDDDDMSDSD